jgi:NhaP-type Na+/H+ or K+/H+ antiporter
VITLGTVWGIAGGAVLGQILKRHALPDYLQNYGGLALVLLVFSASNAMGQESGLVAVTVMGLVLANMKDVDVEELLSFKEHLTVVLISMLFILLAARLDIAQVESVAQPAFLVLLVGLFVARPLSVLLSSFGTSVNWREMVLLGWIAPRGIVAAAISSLFALKLAPEAEAAAVIVPLTFVMIIGTVVVQSLTAGWLAQKLKLSSRGEQGVVITSSNVVALTLGEALMANGIKVKIVDSNSSGLREARMKNMDTFYGNPLSEHAERLMDLTGFTSLLAVSRNAEANAVVCARYRHEFGSSQVFSVRPGSTEDTDQRQGLVRGLRTNALLAMMSRGPNSRASSGREQLSSRRC